MRLLLRKSKQRSSGIFDKKRQLEAGSVAARLNITRKIFPSASICNPLLLNSIRIKKKHKYVGRLERIVSKIRKSRKATQRQAAKHFDYVMSQESSAGPLDLPSSNQSVRTPDGSPRRLSECARYQLPESASNRTGRWQPSELVSLKLAMGVFGD